MANVSAYNAPPPLSCAVLCYAGTILRNRRISSVALFGVMVELTPGKTGLVHLSELGEEGQVLQEVPPQFKVCADSRRGTKRPTSSSSSSSLCLV